MFFSEPDSMRYRHLCELLVVALGMPWMAGIVHAETAHVSYESLLARLGSAHPDYRAMQGEARAALSAIDVARALPDPTVRVELMEIDDANLRPDQVGTTKYTFEQMFPLWGKRGLRRDAAEAGYAAAQARADLTLAELRAMLRAAYAELYAAHMARGINVEVQALVEDMGASAGKRYANGIAAQQDVIKARTEQTMLLAETQELNGRYARASVVINSLVGDPLDTPVPAPAGLPETSSFTEVWKGFEQSQGSNSPALAIADQAVQQRRASRDLAARERYPDLTVGVTPVQTGNSFDTWELMLGVNVPLYGGTRAAEKEQVAMLAAAEDQRRAKLLSLRSAAAEAKVAYEAARARQKLFDERLLVESQISYRSAIAGYQGGQVDFDTLIEAGRQIRNARLQSVEAAVQQQMAVAQFERITGVQP